MEQTKNAGVGGVPVWRDISKGMEAAAGVAGTRVEVDAFAKADRGGGTCFHRRGKD
jgi:hypothetical protein